LRTRNGALVRPLEPTSGTVGGVSTCPMRARHPVSNVPFIDSRELLTRRPSLHRSPVRCSLATQTEARYSRTPGAYTPAEVNRSISPSITRSDLRRNCRLHMQSVKWHARLNCPIGRPRTNSAAQLHLDARNLCVRLRRRRDFANSKCWISTIFDQGIEHSAKVPSFGTQVDTSAFFSFEPLAAQMTAKAAGAKCSDSEYDSGAKRLPR
jgi:hypothetical protein